MKRLLNQTEAAKYCGMSVATFKSKCKVDPIAFTDTMLRYDVQKLDKWIDGLQDNPILTQEMTAESFLDRL